MKLKWTQSNRLFSLGIMIIASMLFAAVSALAKYASQTVSVFEVVFFRSFIGFCLLTSFLPFRNTPIRFVNKPILILRGVSGSIALFCYFFAISKIKLADAVMLSYTSPLFVAILATIFLKEKVNRTLIFVLPLFFLGIYLILKPTLQVLNYGGFMSLLCAFFASIAYISIRYLRLTDSPLTIVYSFTLCSTLLTPLGFIWADFKIPNLKEWVILISIGMIATLAQSLMTIAFKYEKATNVSLFASFTTVFSAIYGIIIWNEMMDFKSVLGGIIIIGSGLLLSSKFSMS